MAQYPNFTGGSPVLIQRDPHKEPVRASIPPEKGWYDVIVLLEKDGWFAAKGATEMDEDGYASVTLTHVRRLNRVERMRPVARATLRLASKLLQDLSNSF